MEIRLAAVLAGGTARIAQLPQFVQTAAQVMVCALMACAYAQLVRVVAIAAEWSHHPACSQHVLMTARARGYAAMVEFVSAFPVFLAPIVCELIRALSTAPDVEYVAQRRLAVLCASAPLDGVAQHATGHCRRFLLQVASQHALLTARAMGFASAARKGEPPVCAPRASVVTCVSVKITVQTAARCMVYVWIAYGEQSSCSLTHPPPPSPEH